MKPYLTMINLLLIAGGGFFGFQAYGKLAAPEPAVTVAVPPEPERPREQRNAAPGVSYATIVRRNLFNTGTDDNPGPAKIDVDKLAQTKLNLKLWGTVTGITKEPFAVIEEKGKRRQNLYRVGDFVQSANIKLILREKVILAVDGRDEVLEMEKRQSGSSTGRPAARRVTGTAGRSSGEDLEGTGDENLTERQVALNRGEMEAAVQNVNELMRQVRIRPYFRNGKPSGLSFTGIRPNSIFRKMGLRNGDIITGVNEAPVENMNDAVGLFEQIGDGDGLRLKIRRRGREQFLKYAWE